MKGSNRRIVAFCVFPILFCAVTAIIPVVQSIFNLIVAIVVILLGICGFWILQTLRKRTSFVTLNDPETNNIWSVPHQNETNSSTAELQNQSKNENLLLNSNQEQLNSESTITKVSNESQDVETLNRNSMFQNLLLNDGHLEREELSSSIHSTVSKSERKKHISTNEEKKPLTDDDKKDSQ